MTSAILSRTAQGRPAAFPETPEQVAKALKLELDDRLQGQQAPIVGLIVPTHKRPDWLHNCLLSIQQQSYPHWFCVIIDDGNGGDAATQAVLTTFGEKSRFHVIHNPNPAGASWSRKLGIDYLQRQNNLSEAMGGLAQRLAYLGWVDDDDWLHTDCLKHCVELMEQPQHQAAAFVYTQYLEMPSQPTGKTGTLGKRCLIPYSDDRSLIDFITFHFRLIRWSKYCQTDGVWLKLAQDWDISLKLAEVGSVLHLPKPLYYFRTHPHSITHQHSLEQVIASMQAVKDALKRRHDPRQLHVRLQPFFQLHQPEA